MKNSLKNTFLLAIALLPWSGIQNLSGQSYDLSLLDYFTENEVVKIEFKANFDSVLQNKRYVLYNEGLVSFKNKRGQIQQWPVQYKLRGKFRRMRCQFPPLLLKFDKDFLAQQSLKPLHKYKLVTHCIDDDPTSSNLLEEYLAYQLYARMDPHSFRVHLAEITYVNTGSAFKNIIRYGFLIESVEAFAERFGFTAIKRPNVALDSFRTDALKNIAMFQFLIGNADWDPKALRNIKLFYNSRSNSYVPVPYDFDMSGLVDPIYGIPNPDYKLKTLKDRIYLGPEVSTTDSDDRCAETLKAFYVLVKKFKLLAIAYRREIIAYLKLAEKQLEATPSLKQGQIAFYEEN